MPGYVYIHGFNSGSSSRSGRELTRVIGAPVFCPQNDYSRPFRECLDHIASAIRENMGDEQLCVMGTSLGGFFALQLRMPRIGQVIAWNPVIYPAMQLARFLGENVRFTDNVHWHFGQNALQSYAEAPDPREWDNFYLRRLRNEKHGAWSCGEKPRRDVVLGTHDELLDGRISRHFWHDHASMLEIDSGHHIENFEHVLTLIE